MTVPRALRAAIGIRLRALRSAHNVTLVELASRSGVSVSTLSRIENAQMGITVESVLHLAKTLRVEPADLLPSLEELDLSL